MNHPQLIPLTDLQKLAEAGIYLKSKNAAYWKLRKRVELGLSGAFVYVGRNAFIDPAKYHELARQNGST